MRLLALTYGTEGDTRPLVMLCHGLIAAGHEVMLMADGGTLGSAKTMGARTPRWKATSTMKWWRWSHAATAWPPPAPGWHGWRCSTSPAGCARPMLQPKAAMRS